MKRYVGIGHSPSSEWLPQLLEINMNKECASPRSRPTPFPAAARGHQVLGRVGSGHDAAAQGAGQGKVTRKLQRHVLHPVDPIQGQHLPVSLKGEWGQCRSASIWRLGGEGRGGEEVDQLV